MSPSFYWTLLALSCAYALSCGQREERVAAIACVAATVLTLFLLSPLNTRYYHVETGVLLVDVGVLAVFTGIALQSHRFWPLWVAGLQLTTTVAHMLKGLQMQLMPEAYGAAMRLWSYPILVILAVATFRGQRRHRRNEAAT